jgi:hypothetical protein
LPESPKLPKIEIEKLSASYFIVGCRALIFGDLRQFRRFWQSPPLPKSTLQLSPKMGYISAHVHLSTKSGTGGVPASVCP